MHVAAVAPKWCAGIWPRLCLCVNSVYGNTHKDDEVLLWKKEQERMQSREDLVCEDLGVGKAQQHSIPHTIWMNERHQVMYCCIAKVTSTSWARRFALLSGPLNETQPKLSKIDDIHRPGAMESFGPLTVKIRVPVGLPVLQLPHLKNR